MEKAFGEDKGVEEMKGESRQEDDVSGGRGSPSDVTPPRKRLMEAAGGHDAPAYGTSRRPSVVSASSATLFMTTK